MKTYLFVRNIKYRPSTYYRIYQYIEGLSIVDIEVCEFETNSYYEKKTNSKLVRKLHQFYFGFLIGYIRRLLFLLKIRKDEHYIIFVQREIFPRFIGPIASTILKKVLLKSKRIYWDFDDNIFGAKEITNEERIQLCENSNKILVGNEYLKNQLQDKYFYKVEIVNTTDKMMEKININELNRLRLKEYDNKIVLVWVGTKVNLKYLESIVNELDSAAMQLSNKQLILKVVSNAKLEVKVKKMIIVNIEWKRDIAFEEMQKAHVGLMPLNQDDLTMGKCAFKAIQNIGCGLPIIVSDVGMNNEVIRGNGYLVKNREEWVKNVIKLSTDKENWLVKSVCSRELWENKFNSEKIEKQISDLFLVDNIK